MEKLDDREWVKGFDPKDDWHYYTLEWTPEHISFLVDHKEIRRVGKDEDAFKEMSRDQNISLGFWTPSWNEEKLVEDNSDMPWYVYFDYLEV